MAGTCKESTYSFLPVNATNGFILKKRKKRTKKKRKKELSSFATTLSKDSSNDVLCQFMAYASCKD